MSGEIRIEGLAALDMALATALEKEAVREAVRVNASELNNNAKSRCPVGTPETTHKPGYQGGTLRRSIVTEIIDDGMTAEIEPHTEYAAYVEYGTRYMKAQPYMRPAFQEQQPKFINDIKRIMGG